MEQIPLDGTRWYQEALDAAYTASQDQICAHLRVLLSAAQNERGSQANRDLLRMALESRHPTLVTAAQFVLEEAIQAQRSILQGAQAEVAELSEKKNSLRDELHRLRLAQQLTNMESEEGAKLAGEMQELEKEIGEQQSKLLEFRQALLQLLERNGR